MKSGAARLLRHAVFLAVCLAVVNPWVIVRFDPHPPLSEVELFLVASAMCLLGAAVVASHVFGWKLVAVNVVVIVCLLFVVNGAARILVPEFDHFAFRSDRPEPYRDAAYFSGDFLVESFAHPGGWTMKPGTDRLYPDDFHGRWFNTDQGIRRTLFQPAVAAQTVYLFGGSTVFNSEVPDEFTIASQLQRLVGGVADVAVVNLGVTSVHSGQQLSRLKADVDLAQGDVVVFYDGVNDVMQRVVYESREGYIVGKPRDEPFGAQLLRKLSDELDVVRVVMRLAGPERDYPTDLMQAAAEDYVAVQDSARAHAERHGASFFHFLQPTIYTKADHNAYERKLLSLVTASTDSSIRNAYLRTYPMMQARLAARDYSTDLTGIFDGLERSPYLDFCHVGHVGNRLIAESIFATIRPALRPRI